MLPEAHREIHHGDPPFSCQAPECLRATQPAIAAQHQRCPREQSNEDFLHRHVEAEGGKLQDAVLRAYLPLLSKHGDVIADRTMLDHHAVGLPRGTGGVDHVGQVLRCGRAIGITLRLVLPNGIVCEIQHQQVLFRSGKQTRKQGFQMILSQQHCRSAVLQHEVQSLCGISRIQRHIGCARLQCRQHSDDHFQAAFDADRYPSLRLYAGFAQIMRQLIAAAIQIAIRQLPVFIFDPMILECMLDCRRRGCPLHLLFK